LHAAERLDLDAAAEELALEIDVPGHYPPAALAVHRQDGRVVADLTTLYRTLL
jgi:hypothetical protein